jgi:hypothetical protein
MADWHLIQQAGLSHQDVADYLGVSRFSVFKWINGQCKPNQLVEARVELFLVALAEKLADGTLPLNEACIRDLAREERRRQLQAALS